MNQPMYEASQNDIWKWIQDVMAMYHSPIFSILRSNMGKAMEIA